jgi:putative hydrolase of the HAD superfamily
VKEAFDLESDEGGPGLALEYAACDQWFKPDMERLARRFANIESFVFDLDNTLYPIGCDLWSKIDARITLFMAALFGLDGLSSRALQKYYYHRFGTTLRGLMDQHNVDPHDFLDFVHHIDRSSLLPNLGLAEAIGALPGRKLILTNGSREHAVKTAEALGLGDIFDHIFDIVAADFVPKPELLTYERFFATCAVEPKTSVLFEDLARNLVVPHEKGMVSVLVVPKTDQRDWRDAVESSGRHDPHIDFVTSDLEAFLRAIRVAREG